MIRISLLIIFFVSFFMFSCKEIYVKGSFGYDLNFLSKYKDVVVLKDDFGKRQIVIVPDYQARVMTSTADGESGYSYGWINYDLIASDSIRKQINAFGGENRFWIGPEGGQYSLFFEKGKEFKFDNWQTPKPIDIETFDIVNKSNKSALFTKKMTLKNYSNFTFNIKVDRQIYILDRAEIQNDLNIDIDSKLDFVSYSTIDKITNISKQQWKKNTGLLSIWVLGMFIPSDETFVIIPYKNDLELNTKYFGDISNDRIHVYKNFVIFKGDGKYRSKIGLPHKNIIPMIASYDHINNVLTIVKYSFDEKNTIYVNSLWEYQKYPYRGDVVNSYNDGPTENGDILGPFYELESSSHSAELKQGEYLQHKHTTHHFKGNKEKLNDILNKLFGISIDDITIPKNN